MAEVTEEALDFYADNLTMVLALRHMRRMRKIGRPHKQESVVQNALNALSPGYREDLLKTATTQLVYLETEVTPPLVAKAVRHARMLIEAFGYSYTPRRTREICQ